MNRIMRRRNQSRKSKRTSKASIHDADGSRRQDYEYEQTPSAGKGLFAISGLVLLGVLVYNLLGQPPPANVTSSVSGTGSQHSGGGAKAFSDSMKNNVSVPIVHTPKRELRVRCKSYGDTRNSTAAATQCYGDNEGMVPYVASLLSKAGYTFTNDDDWDFMYFSLPQRRYPAFAGKFGPGLFTQQAAAHPYAPMRLWCDAQRTHEKSYAGTYFPGAGDKCRLLPYLQQIHKASPLQMYIDGTDLYALPTAAQSLAAAMRKSGQDVWILKTCTGSKGQGQKMVTLAEVESETFNERGWFLGQPYLNSPALFEGRKFHLRIYVLITNYDRAESDGNIRAYIAREGLLKVSSKPFVPVLATSLEGLDSEQREQHLKEHNRYHVDETIKNRRLTSFLESLDEETKTRLWSEMKAEIGRILACIPTKDGPFQYTKYGRCFDFFGLDVIFNSELRPQLLEVNLGPMMGVVPGDEEDLKMKTGILGSVINWTAAELRSTAPMKGSSERIKTEEQILLPQFERLPTTITDKTRQCGSRGDSYTKMDSIGTKIDLKKQFRKKKPTAK